MESMTNSLLVSEKSENLECRYSIITVGGTYMYIKTVSPTKINTFNECPFKYHCKYVRKLPGVFNDKQSTDALQFGSYIHRIFELGFECETVEELFEIAEEVKPKYEFATSGPKGYGKKKIANCINNFFTFNKALSKTVGAEDSFKVEADSFSINGIIDRVIIGEDGGYLVIDYKTSKRMKTPTELYSDPQMLMYTFAVHHMYNIPYNKITMAHWYPVQNKLVSVRIPGAKVEQYVQRKLKNEVWSIRKLKTDEFKPRVNKFCDWCDMKQICPAHNSQTAIDKEFECKAQMIEEAKEARKAYYAEQDAKKKST